MSWIEAVFSLGAALKELRREGWVRRGVAGPESVADHSYSLALLSMLVAAERGLDPFRAAAIAVIHDLAEVITGDLPPDEKSRGGDYVLVEKEAMRRIAESLPERACSLVQRLYEEYASQSSEEARLVKQLDKLEMAFQSIRYEREGRGSKGLAREFTKSALEEIIDPDLRGLL
ncbi:MAG: HD domain-containing protein [Nitrososphaerota archaeon]|nr:HD family hydrolase [Candidatus Calditenuaceae archaeon]MDW8073868.1 HD domain-containing protein [Nitrososphaerota archaeon]